MEKQILEILKVMQQDIVNIKETQNEHTQLFRALEHKVDVIKSEQKNLNKEEIRELNLKTEKNSRDLLKVEVMALDNAKKIAELKLSI